MRLPTAEQTFEHPADVLSFCKDQTEAGERCALVVITDTLGGAVRDPGALMAVTESGHRAGYLSGGCIDADIALHAEAAIRTGRPVDLRYGRGSPFIDIKLPCGGGISLSIIPAPDMTSVPDTLDMLEARQPTHLTLPTQNGSYTAHYTPKLALRIAGRGADPVALARLSSAAGIITSLWSHDEACLTEANGIPGLKLTRLVSPNTLPEAKDDSHSAFVLMMHDHDWESVLLEQALTGDAFYIGAVGSPNTHAKRREALAARGVPANEIDRIHGPIGLVSSLRDASMLAISALAEIIQVHRERCRP